MCQICEQAVRRALFDQGTAIHDGNSLRGFADYAQIVANQDQPHAGILHQLVDQVQDLALDGDIQGRSRLVRQQNVLRAAQRHGYRHPLPLAAGHLMRIGLDAPGRIGQANPV